MTPTNSHPFRRDGFTLVEMSIVLVIVALLVAGVVVGRDMIENAQLRSLGAQIAEIEQAVLLFRGQYDCTPGDCVAAAAFGLGTAGNGNRLIDNAEPPQVWRHLTAAGLMRIDGANRFPTSVPFIQAGVAHWNTGTGSATKMPLKLGSIAADGLTYGNSIPPDYAYRLDVKFDDGHANTCNAGWRIVAGGNSGNSLVNSGVSSVNNCGPDNTNCCLVAQGACHYYSRLTTAPTCGLVWRLPIEPK